VAAKAGAGQGRRLGTKRTAAKAKKRLGGRPVRLAHVLPGSDRRLKRERALEAARPPTLPAKAALELQQAPPASAELKDILCLPNPEWLPHELLVSGPQAALVRFRAAASGPGFIPWVADYDRLEEDWVHTMLTPPPAERGISVEGARILARQVREKVELLGIRASEAASLDRSCPFDLHALVPIPVPLLRLGPDDPAALTWLWENWGTTWALRGVAEMSMSRGAPVPAGHDCVCYRFWSADWAPWSALASIRLRWPSINFQIEVCAVAE
jgi:hypothetical protein